jgi:hypothetical protein
MNFELLAEKLLQKHFLIEQEGKTIVIFPGGFHPFHLGHKSIFDNIQKTFPSADTYIAITGYTEERPFTAAEKKLIISSTGIDSKHIIEVKSPFRAEEILKNYNPNKDKVIFAVSEKEKLDPSRKSLFVRTKKDGTPSYFQDYNSNNLAPFGKHGYIYVFPSIKFGKDVFGKDIKSASELRNLYNNLKDSQKVELIKKMYTSNFDKIKKIFDKHLANGGEEEEMSTFLDKELIKDKDKEFNDVYLNPPYKVDGELTVGRMKY